MTTPKGYISHDSVNPWGRGREMTVKEGIWVGKVGPSRDKESRHCGEGGQEKQPKGWCCL